MKRILFIVTIAIVGSHSVSSQGNAYGKIKVYFNYPVDTSISTGTDAIYLNRTVDDTLIAYLNRTKYTLDVAMYNYIQMATFSDIATAVNNAYSRGVTVRWIYDGSSSNNGLSLLNSTINRLPSPTGSSYGIMHNKFLVMDANSANTNDPIVWTGSCNLTGDQINSDVNNIIIIQDKNLAQAYTTEFNQMWGDSTATPNPGKSRFGPFKKDITPHLFSIDNKVVESYFSPSDSTNSKIIKTICSANTDMYFGMYTFMVTSDADSIKSRINQNVYTAGIIDQYSQPYAPYTILSQVMGNLLKVFAQDTALYHNKFLLIDPSNPGSDPSVLTGSHNWTVSADTKNDENTLIVHDVTIANVYFQSFYQNFTDLGGKLNPPQGINPMASDPDPNIIHIYPNPFTNSAILQIHPNVTIRKASLIIFDLLGKPIKEYKVNSNHSTIINDENLRKGLYIIKLIDDGKFMGGRKICVY